LSSEADDAFFDRADAHLRIASGHLGDVPQGRVSASLMYACARFNVWVSANRHASPDEVRRAYGETIEYFIAEYRKMLVKNLDEYVANFDKYREPCKPD
jgi:hypothetical protein